DRVLETERAAPAGAAAPPGDGQAPAATSTDRAGQRRALARRRRLARRLASGALDQRLIDIEVEEPFQPAFEGFAGTGLEEVGVSLADFFSQMAPARK